MHTKERISREPMDHDAWTCLCGNKPTCDGFRPRDAEGVVVEPVPGWGGLYVCDRCGRIIKASTLEVVGRWKEE